MEKVSALNILEKWAEFCQDTSHAHLAVLRKAGEWYCHERAIDDIIENLWELEARDGIFPEVQSEPDDSVGGDASTVYSRIECISTGYPEPEDDNESSYPPAPHH